MFRSCNTGVYVLCVLLSSIAFAREYVPQWVLVDLENNPSTPWVTVSSLADIELSPTPISHVRLSTADSAVIAAVSRQESVRMLDLSRRETADALTDEMLGALSRCKAIEWLNISDCNNLSDACLDAIAMMPHLKTLIAEGIGDRAGGRGFTTQGIEKLARSQSLQALYISTKPVIGEDPYAFFKAVSKIRSLRQFGGVVEAGWAAALCDIPGLSVCGASTVEAVDVFAHRAPIESLRLAQKALTNGGFWPLPFCSTLRELILEGEGHWDPQELNAAMNKCPELSALTINNIFRSDSLGEKDERAWFDDAALRRTLLAFDPRRTLKKLTSLNLDRNPNISPESVVKVLEAYPDLTNLSLQGCAKLDGRVLDALANLRKLKHLRIGFAFVGSKLARPSFVPDDAAKLAKLTSLESLDLSGTDPQFAKEALTTVFRLKNLRRLRMAYCGLDDAALANAAPTELRCVDFEANQITTTGLHDASKLMPKLEALSLSNGRSLVAEDLPEALAGFSSLTTLRIRSVELDSKTLEAIRKKLPKCAIDR